MATVLARLHGLFQPRPPAAPPGLTVEQWRGRLAVLVAQVDQLEAELAEAVLIRDTWAAHAELHRQEVPVYAR